MAEIRLSIPNKELNVNSLVFVLKENMADIALTILEALLHGIEKRTISELKGRLDYRKLDVLFSHGGPGIQENLPEDGMAHRRCIWHEKRDPKARAYIENLSEHLCAFFDWCIEHKQWIPITTNAVEIALSQVKNCIKRIGKRWTEKGLINWLSVTVKKAFFAHTWDNLWKQYLRLNLGAQSNKN